LDVNQLGYRSNFGKNLNAKKKQKEKVLQKRVSRGRHAIKKI